MSKLNHVGTIDRTSDRIRLHSRLENLRMELRGWVEPARPRDEVEREIAEVEAAKAALNAQM